MANNIYPLNFKPGIKRDGTLFQADYCTDGQWVRFQRGYIRKIGGMKGGVVINAATISKITNLTIVPLNGNNNNIGVYTGRINAGAAEIIYNQLTQNFTPAGNPVTIYTINNQPQYIWTSTLIIQNNSQNIVFLGSPNADNINSNAAAQLVAFTLPTTRLAITTLPKMTGLSGLLYTNPYLFVYGSNGLVQWSKPTNPVDFGGAARSINISNDKVIYAANVRGGVNSPTILFWTLTSVVRAINTGTDALAFQIDTISKSSSILSSRCVVEHRGVFFWPGTDSFFIYNGIEDDLSNLLSLDYFFNNIDMNLRQQVFGVKNTKYGEIWWFYPEKAGAPMRDNRIPPGENSRAIIYNYKDKTWYDTAISRSGGVHSADFGLMSTVGRLMTNPASPVFSIWRHEYETFNAAPTAIMEVPDFNNLPPVPIPSSFTTPTISWAAFNPMKQLTGVDRWMEVVTIEPDFTLLPANTDLTVTVNSKQYAQDVTINSRIYPIPPPLLPGDNPQNAKVDIQFQGRHITFSFATTLNFEMGQTMLTLGIGDGQ